MALSAISSAINLDNGKHLGSHPLVKAFMNSENPDPNITVLRNSDNQLFISFVQPHKAVSRDTISRLNNDVLKLSGIDITTFTTHSTRAATTFEANARDVPLDVI